MLQGSGDTNRQARQLRQSMTLPELLLWNALRARSTGLKFRSQHPSGPYIADFYCHERRLVVEVDGEAHNRGDQPARDAARDRWFIDRGINVVRIPATDILTNIDGAVRGILATAEPAES